MDLDTRRVIVLDISRGFQSNDTSGTNECDPDLMISSEIGGRLWVAKTLRVVVYELTNDSNQPSESLPCELTRNDEVDGIFFPN